MTFERIRQLIASIFLLGFVAIWIWIAIKLLTFDPSAATPQLVLSTAFTTVSGTLSATVGAATAAVLGIEVQRGRGRGQSLVVALGAAATASPLVIAAILGYLGIGVLLIIAWLIKGDAAPEVVQSFALGSLGWMAGAFVAVVSTNP